MAKLSMEQFGQKLERWKRRFPDLVVKAMEKAATTRIIPRVQRSYLTGPRPERLGVVSGRLRRSITHRVDRPRVMVGVGTNMFYGRIWEEVKKKPRPFLRPAIKDEMARTLDIIAEGVTAGYDE